MPPGKGRRLTQKPVLLLFFTIPLRIYMRGYRNALTRVTESGNALTAVRVAFSMYPPLRASCQATPRSYLFTGKRIPKNRFMTAFFAFFFSRRAVLQRSFPAGSACREKRYFQLTEYKWLTDCVV
jgi:hypothetical protein